MAKSSGHGLSIVQIGLSKLAFLLCWNIGQSLESHHDDQDSNMHPCDRIALCTSGSGPASMELLPWFRTDRGCQ